MGLFEDIVEAAKTKDRWALERFLQESDKTPIDRFQRHLALTPAGFLAMNGHWNAVELLFDEYQAGTGEILFGAMRRGEFEQIQKLLNNPDSTNETVLGKICKKHLELAEKNPHLSIWTPVVKALALQGKKQELNAITSKLDYIDRLKSGLLESEIVGQAFAGRKDEVIQLMNTLDKTQVPINDVDELSSLRLHLYYAALKAAARGENQELVDELHKRIKDSEFGKTPEKSDPEKYKFELHLLHTATDGAIAEGKLEFAKTLLHKSLNLISHQQASLRLDDKSDPLAKFVFSVFKHGQYAVFKAFIDELAKTAPLPTQEKINKCLEQYTRHYAIKLLKNNPTAEALQKKYQLYSHHALKLSDRPALLEQICKENTLDSAQKILQDKFGSEIGPLVFEWIKLHHPRAEFIEGLENYITDYNKTFGCFKNHAQRAIALSKAITAEVDDTTFFKLIAQQSLLLNKREVPPVTGKKKDKFNQPASNRLAYDSFTKAVSKCLTQLQKLDINNDTKPKTKTNEVKSNLNFIN